MKRLLVCLLLVAFLATATLSGAQQPRKNRKGAGKRGKKAEAGFVELFNGKDLTGWVGNTTGYKVADGVMTWTAGGNIYTEKEFSDFDVKLEFKLPPGGNNGLGIRAPLKGDAAYAGMEIQILDDASDKFKNIKPYQHCGSIYGTVAAQPGHVKPAGEWNQMEVIAVGTKIKVILNGFTVTDADIAPFIESGQTPDHKQHPGLKNKAGHIGFLGHGDKVSFRNIMIKDLSK
jgi:hypothetical protein